MRDLVATDDGTGALMATKFAGFPTTIIYDRPGGTGLKQLLWGDYVRLTGPAANGWQPVKSRGVEGVIQEADLISERLLEVVFVDIGQGDGALVITPDDRHLIVDAGQEDNFYRFLRWRYGRFEQPFTFEAAIISHPDQDHYKGFQRIFSDPNIRFNHIYHNGIIERAGKHPLGPRSGGFLTDVIETRQQLEALLSDPAVRNRKQYPTMLHNALVSGRVADARALSARDRHLPGFAPAASELSIEVLGPVRDSVNGEEALRWFGDGGKTKNGHSVVLRLIYRDVSLLLGGDLNIPAEYHLLAHHTGYPAPPSDADRAAALEGARQRFRSNVAKACHHGSADFTDFFLQAVDPLVTVISSGDDEPHAHPRADALGAVGRWGRGSRPLVFSTELARSAPEAIKQPFVFRKQLADAQAALAALPAGPKRDRALKEVELLMSKIERSVAVYGAINLRSDGRRIVMAQKIERPSRVDKAWDVYALEPDANGVLRYKSKHDH